jgi:hypothetical protein
MRRERERKKREREKERERERGPTYQSQSVRYCSGTTTP